MVAARLGLYDEPKTFRKVSEDWKLSMERTRQIVVKALHRVRHLLEKKAILDLTPTAPKFPVYDRYKEHFVPGYVRLAWEVEFGFCVADRAFRGSPELLTVEEFGRNYRRLTDHEKGL
jgi:hypothetical protein